VFIFEKFFYELSTAIRLQFLKCVMQLTKCTTAIFFINLCVSVMQEIRKSLLMISEFKALR